MAWDKMKKLIGDFIGRPILQYWNDVIRDYEPVQGRGGANFVELTNRTATKTVTIPSGQSLSGVIDLEGYLYIGIEMPAAWTAAPITILGCSTPDGNFKVLQNEAKVPVRIPADSGDAAAGEVYSIDLFALTVAPWRYIKLLSGVTGTPVNQAADRNIVLVLKN